MREFVFSISFEEGADPLMDAFIQYPGVRSEGVICCFDGNLWRLERVVGDEDALDAVVSVMLDRNCDTDSISERRCEAQRYHDLIASDRESRVVYTYLSEISRCDSIPTLASRYLPGGLLFEMRRQEHEQGWRILMRDDEKVGLLYDTLHGKLRDGLTFEFDHVSDAETWTTELLAPVGLPPEQQAVLEAAADRGYYETPRDVTLDEIADELGVPRSTVSYRLRRAESLLVEEYLTNRL